MVAVLVFVLVLGIILFKREFNAHKQRVEVKDNIVNECIDQFKANHYYQPIGYYIDENPINELENNQECYYYVLVVVSERETESYLIKQYHSNKEFTITILQS